MTREASCSCGQLRATVEGDPIRVSVCHCLACQRRTGSVFGAQARFAAEQVTVEGRHTDYTRISDEGEERTFQFCPDCGATVVYAAPFMPGMIAIPVGAFADPSFPPPVRSIYEERRHAWVAMPDGMELG
ncbi:MAG TPA: GFA family protein [Gaiellaceae bacterium]|nr:GFA family protein [Gaiellaceae bacterium]